MVFSRSHDALKKPVSKASFDTSNAKIKFMGRGGLEPRAGGMIE